jgi:hypothetical protein
MCGYLFISDWALVAMRYFALRTIESLSLGVSGIEISWITEGFKESEFEEAWKPI